jgi:MFS family permease
VFAANMIIPVYAFFIRGLGGSAKLAGVLFAISFISTSAVNLLVLRLKDKNFLDERMLKLNYLIKAGGWFLVAASPHISTLIAAQIILGIGTGIGSPAFGALISENLDGGRHIHDWGIWNLLENSAIAVTSILSGFVVAIFGFRTLFAVMGLLTLSALIVLHWPSQTTKTTQA